MVRTPEFTIDQNVVLMVLRIAPVYLSIEYTRFHKSFVSWLHYLCVFLTLEKNILCKRYFRLTGFSKLRMIDICFLSSYIRYFLFCLNFQKLLNLG